MILSSQQNPDLHNSHGLVQVAVLQGIPLAVKALHQLNKQDISRTQVPRLIVAGGFDIRLAENREHFEEVQQLVVDLGLQQQVRPVCTRLIHLHWLYCDWVMAAKDCQ